MSVRTVWRPIDEWRGPQTKYPKMSPFKASWAQTEAKLRDEVYALLTVEQSRRATEVVVQLALEEYDFRADGQPRANARNPRHEGVVVQFDPGNGSMRFQCDRFTKWRDNVRAIALGMEALRKVERYGIATGNEQYRGFRSIGAESMAMSSMSREQAAALLVEFAGLGLGAVLTLTDRAAIDRAWKQASKLHHPDRNGSHEDNIKKINAAHDVLLRGL